VINISNASAGDSLDSLSFAGVVLVDTPVPMVAGDDDQSVDDIATAIDTETAGSFTAGAAANGQVTVYRADLEEVGSVGSLSYTATTTNGTVISIVATRWVITPASAAAGNKTYYILDALDPGVTTIEPAYTPPTYLPPATDLRTWSIASVLQGGWLYIPSTHTIHKVLAQSVMGGSGLSATFGTHLQVTLDVAIPSSFAPGDYLPLRVITGAAQGLTVQNIGGATGVLNGQTFIGGQIFDRSQFPQMLRTPITYDSSGTTYAITAN
jgi:hypothetical protein